MTPSFSKTSRVLATQYRRWQETGDHTSLEAIEARLEQLRQARGLAAILLMDSQGGHIWGSARAPLELAPVLVDATRQAAGDGQVHRVGPYRGVAGTPRLDFVAPVTEVDPQSPRHRTRHRPDRVDVPYPAGLARSERQRRGPAGSPRWRRSPVPQRHAPPPPDTAARLASTPGDADLNRRQSAPRRGSRAAWSRARIIAGYRSGGWQAIAGTDWFLVVEVGQDEVFGEAAVEIGWIALSGLLALLMGASGIYLWHQRQQLGLAAGVLQAQAERLGALELLANVTNCSGDAIYAKDLEGVAIPCSTRLPVMSSASRPQRFWAVTTAAVFPAGQAEDLMAIDRQVLAEQRIIVRETVLTTPGGNGTSEHQGATARLAGHVVGIFGISRDITEHKQRNWPRARANGAFRTSSTSLPTGSGKWTTKGVSPMSRAVSRVCWALRQRRSSASPHLT